MKVKTPIAVVGMGCLFPGASDLDTFWQNIVNKIDTTCEVPDDRWIVDPDSICAPGPGPDKALSRRACLINDFEFDPEGFDIDRDFLLDLDPLYHAVLHAGRQAFSDCNTASLNRERIGTVLAAIALPTDASSFITREILGKSFEERLFGDSEQFERKVKHTPLTRNQCLAARVTSLPASILAGGLGLNGGAYTLDAACASSLYAVKLACDELCLNRADAMLAGGVSRPESLYTQVGFSQLRALSPSGRCAPFDESADGLVVGEGAGILVLKRLEDALRDEDHIYAVITGIGLSNDMSGNLLAPESKGQVRALRDAYESAGCTPRDIDLIECHGTGTPIGDLTEINSLRQLWGDSGWSAGQCAIGSVKSMIGHLLTGAGAAGMIKTLLAMKNQTLPPSLHFKQASEGSPLHNSPFRVQTHAEKWIRKGGRPFRAAVSGFGFGGINAHVVFEERMPEVDKKQPRAVAGRPSSTVHSQSSPHQPLVAIIGMDTAFGSLKSLKEFQETVLTGGTNIGMRPKYRWKGSDEIAKRHLNGPLFYGGYMDQISLDVETFHIPPNEIPDILPQQLLMLKVSANAMKDAGLSLRQERPRMGVIIGMEFDFEATNFHLRWNLKNSVREWRRRNRFDLDEDETTTWLESLRDACGPPLTPARTVGALGGIVASRIAREFRFGGPSFCVSGEAASGLRALEIGVRFLQQNETDTVLVGAVDLFGDVRSVIVSNQTRQFTKAREVRPFDVSADGSLPGEGAAALVLKRLDRAIEDNDRIYAVIKGIGCAGGKGIDIDSPSKAAYILSLKRSFKEAGISPDSISFIETHGSGNPVEDQVESEALQGFFTRRKTPCAIGSSKPNIGHTGAAAGLASLIKTSLCLYQEIIPPLRNFVKPANHAWKSSTFHAPVLPQYWLRDRKEGPRRACSSAMTTDGNCMHVILEAFEYDAFESIPAQVMQERKKPLGLASTGLFAVEGNSKADLIKGLDALALQVKKKAHFASKSHLPNMEKVSSNDEKIEIAARTWYSNNRPDSENKLAISIVAGNISQLEKSIIEAQSAISIDTPKNMNGPGGISYSPSPMGTGGDIAFVFPGSGNHYIGMGRRIGVQWPEIFRKMDIETLHLRTQIVPDGFVPWRLSWEPGWEKEARETMISDPLNMIFGQVSYGSLMARLAMDFNIKPSACIGYSLGESAGLFSLGAWTDRDEMLKRMQNTDLFSAQLSGPCIAARNAWNVPDDEDVDWCVAAVNRPASTVRNIINNWPTTRLLIVNTPEQSVIGGRRHHVKAAVETLGCEAVFIEGVVTVHCDVVNQGNIADAYKALHIFPITPPEGVRFYSCAQGRAYDLTSDSAASSILEQAISGFDFTAVIKQAYRDGVRVFLEMGPHASCTGMIGSILGGVPHTAVSASIRDEDEYFTILKFLGALIARRIPVNLDKLYGMDAYPIETVADPRGKPTKKVSLTIGGKAPSPALPSQTVKEEKTERAIPKIEDAGIRYPVSGIQDPALNAQYSEMMNTMAKNIEAVADAHKSFLDFSNELTQSYEKTFSLQAKLLESIISDAEIEFKIPDAKTPVQPQETTDRNEYPETLRPAPYPLSEPAFSRDMCMEFAVGAVEKVLGPEFAVVDTYKARVRLPDEPLMLVDRILSVEGKKASLGSGRLVTEHDVIAGAWYLDGNRAPVCISVEAGQADLFLCAYLGIDLAVKGERTYRLLDAAVEFHRGLPQPGDVIQYHIDIDHFTRQGDTFLFFFNFEGYIGDSHLISMTHGCAGFFTEEEVKNSGGIILTEEDIRPAAGKKPSDWIDLVPVYAESFDDDGVDALRNGNLAACFGELFDDIELADSLRLPGGRMKLIDRILSIDPEGGRYQLGIIRAEADIHPDDWFLTCHFMDDMVMPGTLMYECCAHTLRVFLQRMGWVTAKPGVCYEPVAGVKSVLKCRGPVTPETRHVHYEIEIKEIGYAPEPYVVADALMYADGNRIVSFKDMSMKMTGITREEIESLWKEKKQETEDRGQTTEDSGQKREDRGQRTEGGDQRREGGGQKREDRGPTTEDRRQRTEGGEQKNSIRKPALYDRDRILAFAVGKPSDAFGEPYKVFDSQRKIARLPGPPYAFMDRVVSVEPEAWTLKPGGWIEAEYDVLPDAWYFKADRSSAMPFSVLLEIALQPCGWLAAYLGSALRSENDLKFRNLGGNGIVNRIVIPEAGTLTMKARMTKISEAADMIIEHFDFQVLQEGETVYSGDTYFGFFSKEALARQVGIRGAQEQAYLPTPDEVENSRSHIFEKQSPLSPEDLSVDPSPFLAMPSNALRMIDRIDTYVPDGGPEGLGFIRGVKEVDPDEWFFKAHFFQDPVCPGSLGIESFLQLIKFAALDRWKNLAGSHRFELITERPHVWSYRGQVIPENKKIEVEAVVTEIQETPFPMIQASGFLKVDGLYIYEMKDFGFRLIPV